MLEAGAEAKAIDERDNGHRQLAQGLAHLVQAGDERPGRAAVQRHHLVDVGATDPGLVASATQDHGSGGVIGGDPRQCIAHLGQRGRVDDIESLRADDRQPVDRTLAVLLGVYQERVGGSGVGGVQLR